MRELSQKSGLFMRAATILAIPFWLSRIPFPYKQLRQDSQFLPRLLMNLCPRLLPSSRKWVEASSALHQGAGHAARFPV